MLKSQEMEQRTKRGVALDRRRDQACVHWVRGSHRGSDSGVLVLGKKETESRESLRCALWGMKEGHWQRMKKEVRRGQRLLSEARVGMVCCCGHGEWPAEVWVWEGSKIPRSTNASISSAISTACGRVERTIGWTAPWSRLWESDRKLRRQGHQAVKW